MRTHRSILAMTATALLAAITGCGAPADLGVEPAQGDDEWSALVPGVSEQAPAAGRRTTRGQRIGAPVKEDVGSVTPAGPPENNPGTETCPGELIVINEGTTELMGSTDKMTDDMTSWCGDTDPAPGSPDAVYQLSVQTAGSLSIRVSGGGDLIPAFQLRQESCGSDGNFDYCVDTSQALSVISGHFAAGEYWLVVDGAGMTSGSFDVVVALDAPSCGDGILNPGEACDPGDVIAAGDGCDSLCQFEIPLAGDPDTCGDATPIELLMNTPASLTGHTTGYADDYDGSCSTLAGGMDRVYAVFPAEDGTLTATIGALDCDNPYGTACWDRVLYVREGSCGATNDAACSDDPLDGAAPEQVRIQVLAGQTYWVFVDGYDGASYSHGTYTLDLALTAPMP